MEARLINKSENYDIENDEDEDISELTIGMNLKPAEWWQQKIIKLERGDYDDAGNFWAKLVIYSDSLKQKFRDETFQLSKYKQLAISLCPFFLTPEYIWDRDATYLNVKMEQDGKVILSQKIELYQTWVKGHNVNNRHTEMSHGYIKFEDRIWMILFQAATSILGRQCIDRLNAVWLMGVDEVPEHYRKLCNRYGIPSW